MSISISQLHPLFAAEVDGLDIGAPLDDATQTLVDDAISRYGVLVIHGRPTPEDRFLAFARRFGSITPPRNHKNAQRLKLAEIADLSNLDESNEVRGRDDHRRIDALCNQLWHSDASFRPVRGALSMLHAHSIPPEGGDTEFADLRVAYETLDTESQALVNGLAAWHSIFTSRAALGYTEFGEAERAAFPSARHPMAGLHRSGRMTLFLGAHASHIADMPVPEGKLLLNELTEHATERHLVYRHKWRVGDVVIWDNRCTLHRGRRYEDTTFKRDLRRITTQDVPEASANRSAFAAAS